MPEQASLGISAADLMSKRAQFAAYKDAMTGRTDEHEARLVSLWQRYERDASDMAGRVRTGLFRATQKAFAAGHPIGPRDFAAIADFKRTADKDIWDYLDNQFERLGLRQSRSNRVGIEVYNRLWDRTRGMPKTIIEQAYDAASEAVDDASGPLGKAGAGLARKFRKGGADGAKYKQGQVDSWADNVIRALEQSAYQASAAITDALSGPISASALAEVAGKFDIPRNVLELSFTTHPRAMYRATIGAAGAAIEADEWEYYVPAAARATARPDGFAAAHHLQIKTGEEWEAVREALGHKKAGSWIHTTGFHVGDRGYLLPIPDAWSEAAREEERLWRQKWLDGIRRRKGVA